MNLKWIGLPGLLWYLKKLGKLCRSGTTEENMATHFWRWPEPEISQEN